MKESLKKGNPSDLNIPFILMDTSRTLVQSFGRALVSLVLKLENRQDVEYDGDEKNSVMDVTGSVPPIEVMDISPH